MSTQRDRSKCDASCGWKITRCARTFQMCNIPRGGLMHNQLSISRFQRKHILHLQKNEEKAQHSTILLLLLYLSVCSYQPTSIARKHVSISLVFSYCLMPDLRLLLAAAAAFSFLLFSLFCFISFHFSLMRALSLSLYPSLTTIELSSCCIMHSHKIDSFTCACVRILVYMFHIKSLPLVHILLFGYWIFFHFFPTQKKYISTVDCNLSNEFFCVWTMKNVK